MDRPPGAYRPTASVPTKRTLLYLLKRAPDTPLAEIARTLEISRTATLKHLVRLEADGLVQRSYLRGRQGRPRACFRLSSSAQTAFPVAYTETALCALAFIERHQGRRAVTALLEERAAEVRARHAARLAGRSLPDRVRELGRIRDEEGYMAETSGPRARELVLLEHNCPILALAARYGEACDVERRLFRDLLSADVAVSHRVVSGDPVCRFVVRPRPAGV